VDFTTNRTSADVDIKLISQSTGSGGEKFFVLFYGQNKYKGQADTLSYILPPKASDDDTRRKFYEYIGYGLSRYLIQCGSLACVKVNLLGEEGKDDSNAAVLKDHWHNWVMSLGTDGNFSGEKTYGNLYMSNYFIVKKVTDSLKVIFRFSYELTKSTYSYEDDTVPVVIRNLNTDYSFAHQLSKSIGRRWAYGYGANYLHNTFNNENHVVTAGPSIEYNIFPYTESSSRYFTVRYSVKAMYYNYIDTTIYNKTSEAFIAHGIVSNLSFNQKWGTLNFGAGWYNKLSDWSVNRLDMHANADIRVGGGFSFYAGIYSGLMHDQIYLPRAGATPEEILTKKRALQSNYSFNGWFGLNYTFGAKTNNYVNERFNGYDLY
jgi:hypothetical protein